MNIAVTGHDPIPRYFFVGHFKIGAPMGFKAIQLHESFRIQKMGDPFTRGQLTGIMLLFDPIGPAALQGLLVIFLELCKQIRSFHLSSLVLNYALRIEIFEIGSNKIIEFLPTGI
jgi:hypothetical protein